MVFMLPKVILYTISKKVMVDPNSNPNPIQRLYKKAELTCKIMLLYPYCEV